MNYKKGMIEVACILLMSSFLAGFTPANAQSVKETGKSYCSIENYYKTKWGQAENFISLWKKNHYPLLKKAMEKGDIISITAEKPLLHSGEDTRWDFRVIIVFKTTELAFDPDLLKPYRKELYPDTDKLDKEEQQRFELLLAHWDIITSKIPL
jgi:hypothetical protein